MKAIQFKSFGTLDVLETVDVPTPSASAANAVVAVKSASVNPSDVKNVSGHFARTTLPRIPGRDFSGIVAQGPAEWIGAEVWGTGGDIGSTRDGTHAQSVQVPVTALLRKPSKLTHEQASAVGVTFGVAWVGAIEYAKAAAGEQVAVIGVGGGVGSAVAQIAKSRGCRVIGIDRDPPDEDSPAARHIDDYVPLGRSTTERVRELGGGVDVVFDTVGGVLFETALALVKRRGRVLQISATGKRRVDFDLIDFYHNETQLFGVDSAQRGLVESTKVLAELADGFQSGALEPPAIAKRFDLAHARQAYEAVAAGSRGRVVIVMG